ncbi:MAG: Mrp/NBP35 family ATP-binding protein [Clostridia bacterium]|nr:Mrp/NBP35 family ATP-binding protein [Clostridia bacterium]MDD4048217.1 Mrp/NBP35 family ATP-binding protein [Clostridia bacterium]
MAEKDSACSTCGSMGTEQCSSCSETKKGHELNNIKHVIAVMSGKGGVGKSTVAALLAVSLQKKGFKTGVLDADITGPSIPKLFGVKKAPDASEIGMYPVKTDEGMSIMSINLLLENEDDPVIWRGPLIAGAIKQFWEEVIWGDLDYLVVDLPPGTGDAPLTVMQSLPLDGCVVVTSPQDLAGMVVRKTIKMAKKMDIPILGIVENMSYIDCPKCGEKVYPFGEGKTELMALEFNVPLLGTFPLKTSISSLGDAGEIEKSDDYRLLKLDKIINHHKQ